MEASAQCKLQIKQTGSAGLQELLEASTLASIHEKFVEQDTETIAREASSSLKNCVDSLKFSDRNGCLKRFQDFTETLGRVQKIDTAGEFTSIPNWLSTPEARSALENLDLPKLRTLVDQQNSTRPPNKKVQIMNLTSNISSLGAEKGARIIIADPDDKGLIKWVGADRGEDRAGVFSIDPKKELFYSNDQYHGKDGYVPGNQKQTCIRCHTSGAIFPLESQMADPLSLAALKEAKKFQTGNARLAMEDGRPMINGKLGPEYGENLDPARAQKERGPKFFKECLSSFPEGQARLKGMTAIDIKRLSENLAPKMNCAKCHSGVEMGYETAGSLRFPVGLDSWSTPGRGATHARIMDGNMPKDNASSEPFERLVLSACLNYEFYGDPLLTKPTYPLKNGRKGKLFKHLTGNRCDSKKGGAENASQGSKVAGER